jgi:hypothetical protein
MMANDDRRSEQFIREVDEELRRAQLKAIWDRFGVLIIGVCILVVLVTAGYRGWVWWQARQAAIAGDAYLAALSELEGKSSEEGQTALRRIAEEGSAGYAVLARLRLAGADVAAGKTKEALATYDAVAADGAVVGALRDVARIRGAWVALDAGDLEGANDRARPLDAPGNPWRHAAREVLGLAAYKSNDLAQAREYFAQIQQDAETPADLWMRSGMMMQLIDGQLAAPDQAASSSDGAAAAGSTNGAGNETEQQSQD